MAAIYSPPMIPTLAPAACAYVPTLSDIDELPNMSRGIYVGDGGDLKVTMWGGQEVLFEAVPSGTVLPICVKQIWSTDTTADLLVVLF